MKIFSVFYLLAGVSFGMPMADQDRDSFEAEMEQRNLDLMKLIEQQDEVNKQMKGAVRSLRESNRQTIDMVKNYNVQLKHINELFEN